MSGTPHLRNGHYGCTQCRRCRAGNWLHQPRATWRIRRTVKAALRRQAAGVSLIGERPEESR